jgi:hypothetical protein
VGPSADNSSTKYLFHHALVWLEAGLALVLFASVQSLIRKTPYSLIVLFVGHRLEQMCAILVGRQSDVRFYHVGTSKNR